MFVNPSLVSSVIDILPLERSQPRSLLQDQGNQGHATLRARKIALDATAFCDCSGQSSTSNPNLVVVDEFTNNFFICEFQHIRGFDCLLSSSRASASSSTTFVGSDVSIGIS